MGGEKDPDHVARRKSIDAAFTGVIEAVVKDAVREQFKTLRRDLSELRRAVAKSASARGGRTGPGKGGRRPIYEVCQVKGCNRRHQSRGLCQRHYNRLRNRGTLDFWAEKIKAGQTVREDMIAAQRGIPLSDRPKVAVRARKGARRRKPATAGKKRTRVARRRKSSKRRAGAEPAPAA